LANRIYAYLRKCKVRREHAGTDTLRSKRHETLRPLLALGVVVLAFVLVFYLFVMSNAPRGIVDFGPPTGNFTGTTTITTSYGYLCVASHIPGPGIGEKCSPELYGSLQVPVGPGIFVVWLIALALALGSLAFYLNRNAHQKSPAVT
jgi:hypothetical protein